MCCQRRLGLTGLADLELRLEDDLAVLVTIHVEGFVEQKLCSGAADLLAWLADR